MWMQTLHNLGARKFVVTDLGPLGCLPSQIVRNNTVGTCLDYINDYAKNYNAALKPMLNQLTSALPGSIFCYGEVNAAIQQFITNRPNYGTQQLHLHIHTTNTSNTKLQSTVR